MSRTNENKLRLEFLELFIKYAPFGIDRLEKEGVIFDRDYGLCDAFFEWERNKEGLSLLWLYNIDPKKYPCILFPIKIKSYDGSSEELYDERSIPKYEGESLEKRIEFAKDLIEAIKNDELEREESK